MKPFLQAPPHARVLLEPGRLPMWQDTTDPTGWNTALSLPRLATLCLGLPQWGRVEHPMQAWLEEGEVVVDLPSETALPTRLQHIQLAYLENQQAELHDRLLAALTAHVARLADSGDLPNLEDLPAATPVADWLPWIRLNGLCVLDVPSATPYVGLDLSCRWDEEHGLGVLFFGTEVLAIGDAETARDPEPALAHRQALLAALGQP